MIELYFEDFDIVKTSAREENKHIEGNLDAFTRVQGDQENITVVKVVKILI